jgi:protoporphyrinogen oxidase
MKIAIIGAGVTGLTAALRLSESNLSRIQEIVVFEKQAQPGGLLQSTYKNGYWWDNGGFGFYRSNYLVKLFPDLFREVEDSATKVWLNGNLHPYPYIRLRPASVFSTILNYISANANLKFGVTPSNLHTWLQYRMTERILSESGLEIYLKKLQAKTPAELSPILGNHRLNDIHQATRPANIIKSLFKRIAWSHSQPKNILVYAYGDGVGTISLKLAERCRAQRIKIIYNAEIHKIEKNKSTIKIFYHNNSETNSYQATYAISTIPLDELVEAFIPPVSKDSLSYTKSIAYMDMQIAFFIINRPVILNHLLTLYSFEERHLWKKLVAYSLPNGLSSVLVESTFDPRKEMPKPDILDKISNDLTAELGLFEPSDILVKHSTVVPKAYPIYEIGFETKIATIIQDIESENFLVAGRQGRFLYIDTAGAIQTATNAADKIIQHISMQENA